MDDLISRKWLMECVEEGWIKFETEKDENKFIHLVRDTAPAAQPQRMRGRWSGPFCSKCGISKYNFVKILHTDDGPCGKWNYCPNCGSYNGGEE